MNTNYLIAGCLVVAGGIALVWSCEGDEPTEPEPEAIAFRQGTSSLSGAIFTTFPDGSRVNGNIYPSMEDVYLDGGPGPNAPITAAGLPEGDYFFQVTDPGGKELLSLDHISCRKVHVNDAGVIDEIYSGTNYEWSRGKWESTTCQHLAGVDLDHGDDGAITVQLMPYAKTPNKGGVYKAWMTPVGSYTGDPSFVPTKHGDSVNGEGWEPNDFHGFVPSASKTDNYKVNKGKPCVPPTVTAKKFHDANFNGTQDDGEDFVTGWLITVTEPIITTNEYYTPATVTAYAGTWGFAEAEPEGTLVTASMLDGNPLSAYPDGDPFVTVEVAGECEETHEVVFGDVGLGKVTACKIYDRNGNGEADPDEPPVPGWAFTLSGTDTAGTPVSMQATTGADGCAVFADLRPGTYEVTETLPPGGSWTSTGPTTQPVTVASSLTGATIMGTATELAFTNLCYGEADFGTKGFWHNKVGLTELSDDDIAHVNGLAPYSAPSSYFDDGDEPFDGTFTNGEPVDSVMGEAGDEIAPAGSSKAEVSRFLVDANATGDPREQLAQQLLAFIFNTRHRLDDPDAAIELPSGEHVPASDLVDQAITAWQSGTAEEQEAIKNVLAGFNESDAVRYVKHEPCTTLPA